MSGANGNALPDITLVELERLIKMLGLLGSAHDGEVLAAARFVVRWLDEKSTSWEALLVPEEEAGVVSVGTLGGEAAARTAAEAARAAEIKRRIDTAFKDGFAQGIQRMAAQVKAQGQMAAGMGAAGGQSSAGLGGFATYPQGTGASGLGSPWSGPGASWQQTTGSAQQPAQQAPQGSHAGGASPGPLQLNPYPTGTWKWVAWELLDRGAKGIPGVFRGSREEGFVADVLGRGFPNLTQAQEVWLRDIAGRSGLAW